MSYIQFRGQKREIISQPMWDSNTVEAATATNQMTFFQIPRGGAVGKTLEDTNMVLAGQLPRPQVYHVKAVSFYVKEFAAVAAGQEPEDFFEVLDGVAQIIVGAKVMLEAPLYWLVSGFGPVTQFHVSAGAEIFHGTNGLPGHPYKWFLKHRILIDENENFRVEVTWETAFNHALKMDLMMFLDGELIRSIQ